MIYFIKDSFTLAIKIGYSAKPANRLETLQASNPYPLILLGTIQGGLEHERAYHQRFATCQINREWFKGDILPEVLEIIAKESTKSQQMNVIVAGDSAPYFVMSTNQQQMANKSKLEGLVVQALNEIHGRTPISWVVTGGERLLEHFAWAWATRNKAQIYRYIPKWKTYGKVAAFKLTPKLLRSMFDPKTLLVFHSPKMSQSTTDLIRRADKAGIPLVKVEGP
jgi:hypothetical protein